jgi:hypothetical protein
MTLEFKIVSAEPEGMDVLRNLADKPTSVLNHEGQKLEIAWAEYQQERGIFESIAEIIGRADVQNFAAGVVASILANYLCSLFAHIRQKGSSKRKSDPELSTYVVIVVNQRPFEINLLLNEASLRDEIMRALTIDVNQGRDPRDS